MGWRSIFISDKNFIKLSIKNNLLQVVKEDENPAHFRIEDINFILIDSYNFTISGTVLERLSRHHIPLVVTSNKTHYPVCQISNPYSPHHQMGRFITSQSQLTQKAKLSIWKEIIGYKILSQGYLINSLKQAYKMQEDAKNAKSGSSLLGIEGSWAKYYWSRLVEHQNFSRIPKVYGQPNDTMNSFLNYTYAILRARISSAITENGLLPIFSIFHRRDNNQFALADDMIEPYRWCADMLFRNYIDKISQEEMFLTSELKKLSLSVLHMRVYIPSLERTFAVDEAIRLGMKALKNTIIKDDISYLKDILCHIPK